MSDAVSGGPLRGLKVLEFAAIGPAPFCAMLLSDMGADVVRVDRPGAPPPDPHDVETRGRRSIALDLKTAGDRDTAAGLMDRAEVVLEGYRPGVMERLGLGPEAALARNRALVYGRMTGWGQDGPLSGAAGHDLNYIALSGALHAIGPRHAPSIPLNLIGDFGGGALYLAAGVLAALHHARESGQGQVVDCAMSDGAASLMSQIYGHFANGRWNDRRQSNPIDGASHFYNVYQCADGKWLAVAAIEPKFYRALLDKLGLDDPRFDEQWNREDWPALKELMAARFALRTRDQWCALLGDADACVAPVLSLAEAPSHPHNKARGAFVEVDGKLQPAPAPRFSRTPGAARGGAPEPGAHRDEILRDWESG